MGTPSFRKLLFVTTLFVLFNTFGQQPVWLSDDNHYHYSSSALYQQSKIIIPDIVTIEDSASHTEFIYVDPISHHLISESYIAIDSLVSYCFQWLFDYEDRTAGIGFTVDLEGNSQELFVAWLDSEFIPIFDTTFGRFGYTSRILDAFRVDSTIVFLTTSVQDTNTINQVWLAEKNLEIRLAYEFAGTITDYGNLLYNATESIIACDVFPDNIRALITYPDFILDTAFQIGYPSIAYEKSPSAFVVEDSLYYELFYFRKNFGSGYYDWHLWIARTDKFGANITMKRLTDVDTITDIFYENCLYQNNDTLIVCTSRSAEFKWVLSSPQSNLYPVNSQVAVCSYNMNGNLLWSIEFGGDQYYYPKYLLKGEGNTYYLIGARADLQNIDPSERFSRYFLVHFDGNGTVLDRSDLISMKESLRLYPNPCRDQTNIEVDCRGINMQAELVITNNAGALIDRILINEGKHLITLDVSDFPSGVYHTTLRIFGKSLQSNKLIVLH